MEKPHFFEGMEFGGDQVDPRAIVRGGAQTIETELTFPEPPVIPGCTYLRPGQVAYDERIKTIYNARTLMRPALFALCETASAISKIISWARDKGVLFALRGGAHSYEGFSGSSSLVIDIGKMKQISFDKISKTVTVGAGARLGDIQAVLKGTGYALVCGTCPTVGIAGHILGGGYGFLARAYGLALDSLTNIRLIDVKGNIVVANASTNKDLFWASRGGGGGSFGVVFELTIRVHAVDTVDVFSVGWSLPRDRAANIVDGWQQWAPHANKGITALLKASKAASGQNVSLRCIGQSIAARSELEKGLKALEAIEKPTIPRSIKKVAFWDAFQKFAGSGRDPYYQKERSDFLPSLNAAGIKQALQQIVAQPSSDIGLIFNAYGGAIDDLGEDATAFPHRSSVNYMVHYYAGWDDPTLTSKKMAAMTAFYNGMRPFVPGKAYVNYSDAQLLDFATAYWGNNLARLKNIKRTFDPSNFFRFQQSVPLT
ncbi:MULTISPECIES: FAD-binding oxidoreductase [unclassified Rhizobium]|uniref:FAD-binding oxidoreductase n=1 Tax=unclassified Rhizobium TaxID=2613769 RepID=UPI0016124939|nr:MULTISPECIES: FAD-binding oxidoreductase [unclassified Rhizobium]MBB3290396.1 FAD/FMN-containing dehydrogenase [Rhizobium sp. BK252]MBB3405286.1 FAD/FMN-containing dehydrogenase [Rhizobium sp. BK289]MBB3417723.1 FAD/FMN-containing dehydrogenase [Rhizobium sp. BK284]MBB3485602.1 FAD/FMN-containing dehydrogenase [Rhizobium sp. BK347]